MSDSSAGWLGALVGGGVAIALAAHFWPATSFVHGRETPEQLCREAKSIDAVNGMGPERSDLVRFVGFVSDCDAKTITMSFRVSAASKEIGSGVWDAVTRPFALQLCDHFRQFYDQGWVVRGSWVMSDNISKVIEPAMACGTTTS